MIIRVILLAALAAIGYFVFLRRRRLPIHIVSVFAILGGAALAVLFPEQTDVIANWVGVGRGVDLVQYLLSVVFLFVLIHYYTRFVDLQHQLTAMVREVAILRAGMDELREANQMNEQPLQRTTSANR
jgi:hypothetical protein